MRPRLAVSPRRPPIVAGMALLAVLVAGCAADESDGDPADDGPAIEDGSEDMADGTSDDPPDDLPEAEDEDPGGDDADGQTFPDVVEAELEPTGDGTWRVSATISSPCDTPDRYADAFRVSTPDGTVLGVRELLHDHANEQPFTRSLEDVAIPAEVDRIIVEGRDLANGWGGETVEVPVPS